MEPKIMIIVFLLLLLMCVLFIITKIKYLDLKEEMNRIKAESPTREKLIEAWFKLHVKCKQQSRRIAELIELCNKLQPDLVDSNQLGEDNTYPTSFETLSAMYDKVTTCAHDGMVYVDAHTKVDFKGLKKYLNRK